MNQTPASSLPAAIEAAARRVKLDTRRAAERTVNSLGVSALASASASQRDHILGAQFELNRKLALFCNSFDERLDKGVEREVRRFQGSATALEDTNWDALSLVDNREVELQVSAERFGMQIAQACETEQREVESLVGSALQGLDEAPRNPLRPEVIGNAVVHGVDEVTDRDELRKVLVEELGRSMASSIAATYAAIVTDLRAAGLKPVAPSLRNSERNTGFGRTSSGYGASSRPAGLDPLPAGGHDARRGNGPAGTHIGGGTPGRGTPIGQVDAGLMTLIRRLAFTDLGPGPGDTGFAADAGYGMSLPGTLDRPVAPNLIRAHRDVLREASTGSLDHMVIDVIGSLFDQILSDPKVPPQMARQIARLQLPVLRAALGDASFFSSRKHPVRRFVNRIASLGSAFENLDSEPGKRFVQLVRELVQEIVEGDFDQIEVYEQKLTVLESFIVEQSRHEVQQEAGAPSLLAEKETELRLQQRYMQQLQTLLTPLPMAEFVRTFITQVWSQALMRATRLDGVDSARVQRFRHAGRELIMSVQPKGSPEQRKAFLVQLPTLMKELNEGMALIGWAESAKKVFFGQLLPAHAETLKGQTLSTLDYNLLVRQADTALGEVVPDASELPPPHAHVPVLRDEVIAPKFSAEEAQRIGLIEEAAVDWNGTVDIDLSADADSAVTDVEIAGLPRMEANHEPASGKSLADHVQIGFAYQMCLDDKWLKVRLNHVSAGRSFFVFTHGGRHKKTVSMTYRMLARLCETGRLRAFENAYLIERATARARRQLAALGNHGGAATAA
jgi:hypothetical protein